MKGHQTQIEGDPQRKNVYHEVLTFSMINEYTTHFISLKLINTIIIIIILNFFLKGIIIITKKFTRAKARFGPLMASPMVTVVNPMN